MNAGGTALLLGLLTGLLFLVAPGSGGAWRQLFSTHPPIPDRIRRLLRR